MKKLMSIFLVFVFITFGFSTAYADEEDQETNNLNLNTEVLNNKTEDYNSTTTVGDIDLFTEDYRAQLEHEEKLTTSGYQEINNNLFMKDDVQKETSDTKELFKEPVIIDKMSYEQTSNVEYTGIIIIAFLVISGITFVLTKRRYRGKERLGE